MPRFLRVDTGQGQVLARRLAVASSLERMVNTATTTKTSKRSLLQREPIRVPGQSLDGMIHRVIEDDAVLAVIVIAIAFVLAVVEWLRWYQPSRPQPVILTVLALVASAWAGRQLLRARRDVRRLKLARDGERAVAEELERMRGLGYHILHDIPGDDFDIDHVLVGPHGVFVVETKTISKPRGRRATVHYDGKTVKVDGFTPDRDPIAQAAALGRWLSDLIKESTVRQCFVRPIVVYPGWWVPPSTDPTKTHVWVLNPEQIAAYVESQPRWLTPEEVTLVAFHLGQYVRSKETRA